MYIREKKSIELACTTFIGQYVYSAGLDGTDSNIKAVLPCYNKLVASTKSHQQSK